MKRFICLFLISLISVSSMANDEMTKVGDTIQVQGNGEVTAEPDQAILSLSVNALSKDVEAAKQQADSKYKAVLAAAKKNGIDRLDIKSSGISVQPEYQWRDNSQVLVGTRITRSVTITVNEIDRVAELLQDLVEGEVSTVNNVQTGFKDRKSLERKALKAAIEDAKDKAQFLADQFGKTLGSAKTISETQRQSSPRQFRGGMEMAKSMAADLPEEHFGTQAVRATVNVVFHSN